ncbi:hypothetical protein [Sphingomonas sp. VL_57B]|nr:hypothetical protein [Pseudomonadota bacterium]
MAALTAPPSAPARPARDGQAQDRGTRREGRSAPERREAETALPTTETRHVLAPARVHDGPAVPPRAATTRSVAAEVVPSPRPERRPPPPAQASGDIRIDIGRITIDLPRPRTPPARPQPPPLKAKPRGGPDA